MRRIFFNLTRKLLASLPRWEQGLAYLGRNCAGSRVVKSLCYHTGEAVARRGGSLDRIAVVNGGASLCVSLEEHLFRSIYFHGTHELETSQLLRRLVKPGQTWLDIGANVGVFTVAMAKLVGTEGRVFAYEPNPRLCAMLRRSIALNGFTNVELRETALSDSCGSASLHVPSAPAATPGGSGRASLLAQASIGSVDIHNVASARLDDDLPPDTIVDGIKIDVEGYELAVFNGMSARLASNPPGAILFEASRLPEALATPEELITKLGEYGYDCYELTSFSKIVPGQRFTGGMCDNLLAILRGNREIRRELRI